MRKVATKKECIEWDWIELGEEDNVKHWNKIYKEKGSEKYRRCEL